MPGTSHAELKVKGFYSQGTVLSSHTTENRRNYEITRGFKSSFEHTHF